ncbi:DNA-binding protein WhiA [Metamycoplasma hominis]|uniref:DNA-binding protein WhiA n=1 Tax=Metamycoplasma hominis TaxID=2098 RepID=UPI003CF147FB
MENKSFSQLVKEEIMSFQLKKQEKFFLMAGIIYCCSVKNNEAKLVINNIKIRTYILNICNELKISYTYTKKNEISINTNFLANISVKYQGKFFAGLFLASGSIINGRTNHLELKFNDLINAENALSILNSHGLEFKKIIRNQKIIIYLKKIENICDFLKAIETIESYYLFEDGKIQRDFYNSANRITNLDVYNQERIAKANLEFIKNYQFIKENNLLDEFSVEELALFELKLNSLDSSLNELSLLLETKNIKKSRSALNHFLIKLKKITKKYQKK